MGCEETWGEGYTVFRHSEHSTQISNVDLTGNHIVSKTIRWEPVKS